jgi:hypothetical protein
VSRACGICGFPSPPVFRAPPPELAPDLDLRPGEPTRSTLSQWVSTCAGCGAVAPDLSTLGPAAAETVHGAAYRAVAGPPDAAVPFRRWAMLCPPGERGEAFLQAAWAADDAGAEKPARALRREAATAWGEPASIESALRVIDVLRRAGDFAAAQARVASLETTPMDENSARLVAFQRARIASGDTGRHLISSALRPPAHRPHVSHGRSEAKSFWARVMGR